ncbi:MAG: PepSY domain-containing protein [Chloroflexi bacterium]|nr:PepSY domain-containing protein [Chloroflexota bacterium]
MSRRTYVVGIAVGALAIVSAAAGTGFAANQDSDENVTGPGADAAIAAALQVTGGGTANSVELDFESGATWEVEVTRPDGVTVDVRLDDAFGLVVVDVDSEEPDDDDHD